MGAGAGTSTSEMVAQRVHAAAPKAKLSRREENSILRDFVLSRADADVADELPTELLARLQIAQEAKKEAVCAQTAKQVCKFAESCVNYGCNRIHPPGRRQPCRYADDCKRQGCIFLHPTRGQSPPPTPNARNEDCRFRATCVNFHCNRAHPSGRRLACPAGDACALGSCTFLHPKSRAPVAPAVFEPLQQQPAAPVSPYSSPPRMSVPSVFPHPSQHLSPQYHQHHQIVCAPVPRPVSKMCVMCEAMSAATQGISCAAGHFLCNVNRCAEKHLTQALAWSTDDLFRKGGRITCLASSCMCELQVSDIAALCNMSEDVGRRYHAWNAERHRPRQVQTAPHPQLVPQLLPTSSFRGFSPELQFAVQSVPMDSCSPSGQQRKCPSPIERPRIRGSPASSSPLESPFGSPTGSYSLFPCGPDVRGIA